jgi:FkbH-like protein
MAENVRLIIWDLDETLWKGTVTEGGIDFIEQNHDLVIQLTKRGIISTICSKNDLSTVQSLLLEKGLWSYFVFPSINWEPKGPRIAALIETIMLRPATVMFIDDNPLNLNEAKHYVPELQTATPLILQGLLDNPLFKGKDDTAMTRLSQYKLLESRRDDEKATKATGGTNYEFLRSSNIRVQFEFNIARYPDRAVELINRTNQLNFTKNPLSEDPEKARDELLILVSRYDIQAALVHVADRYGDYGLVGLYAVKTVEGRSDLVHYCFSCRTLGMGIETWVYRNIGRPWLPMVGVVLSDPRDESLPVDWVSLAPPISDAPDNSPVVAHQHQKLVLRGGCNGLSISHYFHAITKTVVSEVAILRNGMPVRLEHSLFATNALNGLEETFIAAVERLGYQRSDFLTQLFDLNQETPIVFLDFWTDAEVAIYKHRKLGFRIPFAAPYHFPVKPESNVMDLPADFVAEGYRPGHLFFKALQTLIEEYEYEGIIGEAAFKSNLSLILSNISPKAKIFILTANEKWLNPGNGLVYTYLAHSALNQWTAAVAERFDNVTILDVRQFMSSEADAETVNHFDRLVYYRISQAVLELAARDT